MIIKEKEMTREQFGDICKKFNLLCVRANKTSSEWRSLTHVAHFAMKKQNSKKGWAVVQKIDNSGDL